MKPLLDRVPPGFLADAAWLKAQGIDPKSIHDYVARGWLERVVRAVYRRPLPEDVRTPRETRSWSRRAMPEPRESSEDVGWESVLLSLQWIMGYDVHLGGESALELAGHDHYLRLGRTPRVHVYGEAPPWLKRLPGKTEIVVHGRTLFGDDPIGTTLADHGARETGRTANVWPRPLIASSPERAILEALDELPNNAGFDDVDKIFESLIALRPRQPTTLLTVCRSVKVRRLFFVFADRHRFPWRRYLDASEIDFGSGPRALVEGGKLHPTYRIHVPKDFVPDDDAKDAAEV